MHQRKNAILDYKTVFGPSLVPYMYPVTKYTIESIIDVIRSSACILRQPDAIDFSALEEYKDGGEVTVFVDEEGGLSEYIFILNIHLHLPDSAAMKKPKFYTDNDSVIGKIPDDVVGFIALQYLGIIDEPKEPALAHFEKVTMENHETKLKVTSQMSGVKSRTRLATLSDTELIVDITHLVGGPTMGKHLWSSHIVVDGGLSQLEVKGAKIYLTPASKHSIKTDRICS